MDEKVLVSLSDIWTLSDEKSPEIYRPVKFVIRSMWPRLANALDRIASDLISNKVFIQLTCPRCKQDQYFTCGKKGCPCNDRVTGWQLPQIHVYDLTKDENDIDLLACPYCGFAMGIDFWQELDWDNTKANIEPAYKRARGIWKLKDGVTPESAIREARGG